MSYICMCVCPYVDFASYLFVYTSTNLHAVIYFVSLTPPCLLSVLFIPCLDNDRLVLSRITTFRPASGTTTLSLTTTTQLLSVVTSVGLIFQMLWTIAQRQISNRTF